ncbi:hypothetical protein AK812_SmicGene32039 [Symbiodinium microadriaticum]|uniref:Uncharacterized protein n=1 Tax=Symbiodinium microadriaticum TaxID=2951 RepID=A0A1Q9CV52_SYMMI|nr:hypothetical protein AK812_SmicGene32039 [Symbiodinium microadriaticum]
MSPATTSESEALRCGPRDPPSLAPTRSPAAPGQRNGAFESFYWTNLVEGGLIQVAYQKSKKYSLEIRG